MKRLLVLLLLFLPSLASAQELHTFSNGEVADAEKINENFENIDDRVSGIELLISEPEYSETTTLARGWPLLEVDCEQDPYALNNEEVVRETDRIHLRLVGECILEDTFSITGQKVYFDGGDLSADGQECLTRATLKYPDVGDFQFLNISAENGSVVFFKCLTLNARDAVELNAYSNSYLRTLAGVQADIAPLDITLSDSKFVTAVPTVLSRLTGSGSTIYIANTYAVISIDHVYLSRKSDFTCKVCSGEIGRITLQENSTSVIWRAAELSLGRVDVTTMSSFYLRDLETENVGTAIVGANGGSKVFLANPDCDFSQTTSSIADDAKLFSYSWPYSIPCE